MPVLVACPSCGCRVQVGEMLLGQRTRCIACAAVFVVNAETPPPPAQQVPANNAGTPRRPIATSAPGNGRQLPPHPSDRLPLCPNCHRPVSWEVLQCPYCDHLFDPIDSVRRHGWEGRRDALPHRGPLIDTLGSISLAAGALTLCTGPIGLTLSLSTGIPALVMAQNDMARMRHGTVDPQGLGRTDGGRVKALIGIIMSVLFGFIVFLWFIDKYR